MNDSYIYSHYIKNQQVSHTKTRNPETKTRNASGLVFHNTVCAITHQLTAGIWSSIPKMYFDACVTEI